MSPACAQALLRIQADPGALDPAVAAHVSVCPACFEAQVAWLAQEPASPVLVPAGYYDHLPGRILAKLPASSPRPGLRGRWAAAAVLLLGVGAGGFVLGRRNPTPVVTATLAAPVADSEMPAPDIPFQDGDEAMAQLPDLTPQELQTVLAHLEQRDNR